jgi:CubicO group peptidase (beta-lactamase class C family)
MIDDAHESFGSAIQPQQLRTILEQIVEGTGVPGISAALLLDGRIMSAAAGSSATTTPAPMCAESRFALGSTGKFLICAAAMDAIVSHQLDYDAPLRTYLPELAGSGMGNEVALRHLMSHTSGYYQEADGIADDAFGFNVEWGSIVQRSIAARRQFAPGTVFSYDTPNYVLCGEILRRLHGVSPRHLIRTRILQPLGIDAGQTDSDAGEPGCYVEGHVPSANGGFEPTTPDAVSELWQSACCTLTLSMPDLIAIAAAVMDVPIGAGAILSAPARSRLLTQVVDVPIAPEWPVRDCAAISYGFGCAAHRNGLLGHPGETAGHCCAFLFDPARGVAVAVGVNARAFHAREATLTKLMRALGYASKSCSSKRPTFELSELVGDYVGGGMGRVFQVRAQGLQLICKLALSKGEIGTEALGKPFPEISLRVTNEGHAVLDERSRQMPLCFFREPGGTTPCLIVGQVSYRQL